jgi:hypothetical protein
MQILALQDVAKSISEQRVRSDELASKHKGRKNKEERMASVLAGGQTSARTDTIQTLPVLLTCTNTCSCCTTVSGIYHLLHFI